MKMFIASYADVSYMSSASGVLQRGKLLKTLRMLRGGRALDGEDQRTAVNMHRGVAACVIDSVSLFAGSPQGSAVL